MLGAQASGAASPWLGVGNGDGRDDGTRSQAQGCPPPTPPDPARSHGATGRGQGRRPVLPARLPRGRDQESEEAHRPGYPDRLRHPQHRVDPRGCAGQSEEVVGLGRLLGSRLGLPRRHVHARLGGLPHPQGTHPASEVRHAHVQETREVHGCRQGHRHLRQRHHAGLRTRGEVAMPRSVVRYDKDLPEIEDHNPFRPPTGYLVKDPEAEAGYRAEPGRRPSQLLLTNKLRAAVDHWRAEGYPGASEVTRRLFNYWFEEEHPTTKEVFRFYFAQQEAIETLAYLVEIDRIRDAFALVQRYGDINYPPGKQMSLDEPWKLQVTSSGQRQIERFFPEVGQTGVQPLPPEGLSRFAFKMATGSGKTVVMAMAIVWSYFHKRMIPGSPLSTNFLVSAPNIIVYQRLEKDFGSNRIFAELPLVPPEWSFGLKVILRGESTEPDAGGNLFLTNIQQVYESRGQAGTPLNPVDAILGRRPIKDLASQQRPILERIKQLRDLVVINDEAHHVHDEELEWAKTLIGIHESLPSGLSLWLDFTATPKFQDGSYYPWCIVDYPLAQAVEDRIVKAPIIVERVTQDDPTGVTKANITHKYKEWVYAALERYRDHERQYRAVGVRPVLFIMCEKSVYADALGGWLVATKEFKLKEEEVLVIHTDTKGEITQADLEKARQFARDVDSSTSRVKVIVSVMMLREGWG